MAANSNQISESIGQPAKTPGALIDENDLMQWTGFKRRDALVNWLRQQRIPYLLGRSGKVCCTTDAVNLPLLHIQNQNSQTTDDIEFT